VLLLLEQYVTLIETPSDLLTEITPAPLIKMPAVFYIYRRR